MQMIAALTSTDPKTSRLYTPDLTVMATAPLRPVQLATFACQLQSALDMVAFAEVQPQGMVMLPTLLNDDCSMGKSATLAWYPCCASFCQSW